MFIVFIMYATVCFAALCALINTNDDDDDNNNNNSYRRCAEIK